ncbi:MAG: hypothetical protein ACOYM3_01855 [Terrimicrobiaceae bacterium]
MFIFINVITPFCVGFLGPIFMDWFAAPHRDPHWLKALLSIGGAILLVTLYHVLRESHSSLVLPLLLGGFSAFAGTLCQRGAGYLRSRMKESRERRDRIVPQDTKGTHVKRSIPPFLETKRELGPLSQKKRTAFLSEESTGDHLPEPEKFSGLLRRGDKSNGAGE